MRLGSKKRLVGLAVVVLALFGGGLAAYAYFTSTGSGTGSAATGSAMNWTVGNVGTSGTMYPGAGSATLTYRVTNAGSGHQAVTGVSVTVAASADGDIFEGATEINGCQASWFSPAASTFTNSGGSPVTAPVDLAGADYITGTSVVTMTNLATPQDACQGRSPKLDIAVS